MSKKIRENIPIIKGIKIFDTHSHLNDEQFEGKVEEVIKEANSYNVGHIAVPGYDLKSSIKAVEIANKYENIYAIVGIHPDDAENYTEEEIANIKKLAKQNETFRMALWTGAHLQITLMNILPNESIGLEIHPDVDQFIQIEQGIRNGKNGRCTK